MIFKSLNEKTDLSSEEMEFLQALDSVDSEQERNAILGYIHNKNKELHEVLIKRWKLIINMDDVRCFKEDIDNIFGVNKND